MNFTKNKEINIPKQNYISNRSPQPNNKLRNYNIQSQGRSPIPNPPKKFCKYSLRSNISARPGIKISMPFLLFLFSLSIF